MDSLGSVGTSIFQDIIASSYQRPLTTGVARILSAASPEQTSRDMAKFANADYVYFSPEYVKGQGENLTVSSGNMSNQIIGNIQNGMAPKEALQYGKAIQSYGQANANVSVSAEID